MTSTSTSRGGAGRQPVQEIVRRALGQFAELSGQTPERVSGVRPEDDGWSLLVEVVDLERVPATTSVLSTYRVDVDGKGNLIGYERVRRFTRSSTDSR